MLELGCKYCSARNFVTSPDPSYTKISTTAQFNSIPANFKCQSCNADNRIFWLKN